MGARTVTFLERRWPNDDATAWDDTDHVSQGRANKRPGPTEIPQGVMQDKLSYVPDR
jgi:hypothetical protein